MSFGTNLKELAYLILIFIAVVFIWDTELVYPLKMLTVFFHEISHGLAAVITGGLIKEIELDPREGGLCRVLGGWQFVILPAGYLGSMTWGGIILIGAARTNLDRQIMRLLGTILIIVSLLYVRPFLSFAFGFGIVTAAGMLTLASFAPKKINDFTLKLIGLTSCLYAVLDVKSDILDRYVPNSDASRFAEEFGGTSYMWGMVWILIAIVSSVYFMIVATRKTKTGEELKAEGK